MTIKCINISDFGKLSGLKIIPSSSFNIIYAPNESGKTTLLEFIKFIFYGLRQKKPKNDLSVKEKYMPWNGMPMCGSIEFESHGKNYIIYRSEGSKSGTKILDVKNADTGEKYSGIDNPGEYFFSVDEKVFSDTFFARDYSALFDPDDSISSAVYGKNEKDSSYSRVRHSIEDEILNLTSSKRGSSDFSLITKEMVRLKEEKLILDKEIETIDVHLSELRNERDYLESQKEHYINEYNAIKNYQSKAKMLEISELREKELENLNNLNTQFNKIKDEKSSHQKETGLLFYKYSYVIFGILIVSLIALYFGVMQKSEEYILCSLVLFVLCFVFVFAKIKKNIKVNNELTNAVSLQIELCKKRICEYENEITQEELNGDNAHNYMSQSDETNVFTNKEINGIINKIQKCEIDVSVKKSQIQSLCEKKNEMISQRDFCHKKINESDLKLGKLKQKQDVYNTALFILDSAFSRLKDCYAPLISEKSFEIFKRVCKKGYDSLVADDSFEISLNHGNELKSVKRFSRSTKDAAGLSLRMAICDSISKENPLPMFFDDVLSSFDDERCFDMMECMRNVSEERQIFLCTCRLREIKVYEDNVDVEVIRF